jgi:hypothetical protein
VTAVQDLTGDLVMTGDRMTGIRQPIWPLRDVLRIETAGIETLLTDGVLVTGAVLHLDGVLLGGIQTMSLQMTALFPLWMI